MVLKLIFHLNELQKSSVFTINKPRGEYRKNKTKNEKMSNKEDYFINYSDYLTKNDEKFLYLSAYMGCKKISSPGHILEILN